MTGRESIVGVALVCLQSSLAFAGEVVTLRCDFPEQDGIAAFYNEVIADQRGISITSYTANKKTGQLEYVKIYTENKKDDASESSYRINSVEIAWEITLKLAGMRFTYSIDLRSGIEKDDEQSFGKNASTRPTSIGHCKPD